MVLQDVAVHTSRNSHSLMIWLVSEVEWSHDRRKSRSTNSGLLSRTQTMSYPWSQRLWALVPVWGQPDVGAGACQIQKEGSSAKGKSSWMSDGLQVSRLIMLLSLCFVVPQHSCSRSVALVNKSATSHTATDNSLVQSCGCCVHITELTQLMRSGSWVGSRVALWVESQVDSQVGSWVGSWADRDLPYIEG